MPETIGTDPITGREMLWTPADEKKRKAGLEGTGGRQVVDASKGWPKVKPEEESTSKSGGGVYYSSGGGGDSRTVNNWFLWWFGYEPASLIASAKSKGWTEDDVRRAAVDNGIKDSPGMNQARQVILQIAAGYFGGNPSAVPASMVDSIIKAGYDPSYLQNTYFPMLKGGSTTNPSSAKYIDTWVAYTGRAIGPTAAAKLDEIIRTYGYSPEAEAAWDTWVKGTESAYTGNYGATQRAKITDQFNQLLGRNPTADELKNTGAYWNLNDAALQEQLMNSPEGKTLYQYKPAIETPQEYLGRLLGIDSVLRWYYGDHVAWNADGSLTIYTGEPGLEQAVTPSTGTPEIPAYEGPKEAPAWKTLTNATFYQEIQAYGIEAKGGKFYRNGVEVPKDSLMQYLPADKYYQDSAGFHYVQTPGAVNPKTGTVTGAAPAAAWKSLDMATFTSELSKVGIKYENGSYTKDGIALSNDEVQAMLPPDTFYYDSQGFHYIQDYGAINPKTGQTAAVQRPAPATPTPAVAPTATVIQNPFANLGLKYLNPEFIRQLGPTTADQLAQQFSWLEEADYLAGTQGDMMREAFGSSFSSQDWYMIASGAKGSGAMRAKLMEGQNRVAFREVYRNYFGTDPGPADYDALTSQFVSPGEFAHRMAAKESAKAQLDQANELMQRVFGQSVSLAELENLAMGGAGSGELQAMLDQAGRMEQYRWIHKQYYGEEATPDDYAKYAGYASSQQLQWEIVTQEKIAEYGDDINKAFQKAYGYELSTEQLQTMLGEMEGYGELNKLYKDAKEEEDKAERAREEAMKTDKISTIYTAAPQGGIKTGLAGLEDLGV